MFKSTSFTSYRGWF